MSRGPRSIIGAMVPLFIAAGCSRSRSAPDLIVEIPARFSGNFSLEMGVKDAPALVQQGNAYLVRASKSGKLSTSTLLMHPQPRFRNSSEGAVWGYSDAVFTTGDGIPVGGKIEFFAGTRKDYEAEESKRNHSSGIHSRQEMSHKGA
jgi:hypothetical protein